MHTTELRRQALLAIRRGDLDTDRVQQGPTSAVHRQQRPFRRGLQCGIQEASMRPGGGPG